MVKWLAFRGFKCPQQGAWFGRLLGFFGWPCEFGRDCAYGGHCVLYDYLRRSLRRCWRLAYRRTIRSWCRRHCIRRMAGAHLPKR